MSKEKEKISFWVPKEIIQRLDKIAAIADIDRSKLIVNMLDEFSKTLDSCGKIGILQLSVLIRNCGEKMQEWAKRVKSKKVEPLD
jgi:hypothetical protein